MLRTILITSSNTALLNSIVALVVKEALELLALCMVETTQLEVELTRPEVEVIRPEEVATNLAVELIKQQAELIRGVEVDTLTLHHQVNCYSANSNCLIHQNYTEIRAVFLKMLLKMMINIKTSSETCYVGILLLL